MKRLILILLIIFALGPPASKAVTFFIGGTVSDSAIGNPVAGHTVFIFTNNTQPMGYNYFNKVYTNSTGHYADTIQVPGNMLFSFFVVTYDCNNNIHSTLITTNQAAPVNFSICTPFSTQCHGMFFAFPDPINLKTIHFTDQSTGNIDNWFWDFGDNSNSTLQHPVHQYLLPGLYQVCLTISNNDSLNLCYDTYCDSIFVHNTNAYCIANFTHFVLPANPLKVMFQDLSFGNPTSRQWDFGDGSFSSQPNPHHQYQSPGIYPVCLSITRGNPSSPNYCTDTFCQLIFIDTLYPACKAGFVVHPGMFNPFTFHFNDLSTGNIDTWYWDFGDGSYDSLQDVTHTYSDTGIYNVCLIVSNSNPGFYCEDTFCLPLNVTSPGYHNLAGQVIANFFPLDYGRVALFRDINGTFMLDQTAAIDSFGVYYFYQVQAGRYLLKAKTGPASALHGKFFPTYLGNVPTWEGAHILYLNNDNFNANILMMNIPPPSTGQGKIFGNVTYSDKHPVFKGQAANNIEILLLTPSGYPLAIRHSDTTGNFSFQDIPFGQYKVHAEVTGIKTWAADVSLNGNNPVNNNVQLIIEHMQVISVEEYSFNDDVGKIYPNPAGSTININIDSDKEQHLIFILLDQTGRLLGSEEKIHYQGQVHHSINVDALSRGMYMLQISGSDNQTATRKFVIIR